MKWHWRGMLVAALVFTATALADGGETGSGEAPRLGVLSYNIHHGEGVDP